MSSGSVVSARAAPEPGAGPLPVSPPSTLVHTPFSGRSRKGGVLGAGRERRLPSTRPLQTCPLAPVFFVFLICQELCHLDRSADCARGWGSRHRWTSVPMGVHPARCSPLGPPAVPPWGLSGRSLSHPEAQIARTRLPFPSSRRGRRFPVFPGPGAGGPSCCSEVFGGGQCLGGVWGRTVQTLPRVPCWFPGPRRSRSAHEVKGREIQLCPDSRTYIFLVSFV